MLEMGRILKNRLSALRVNNNIEKARLLSFQFVIKIIADLVMSKTQDPYFIIITHI